MLAGYCMRCQDIERLPPRVSTNKLGTCKRLQALPSLHKDAYAELPPPCAVFCTGQPQQYQDEAEPSAPPLSEDAGSPAYNGSAPAAADPSAKTGYDGTDPAVLERLQRERPVILSEKVRRQQPLTPY